ncbi:M56 family peptidase [Ancylomarina euxinus]|uniref:M56 family peptidase n=1 Tax=Ancylomarina euxinus TaxID=2283627 RepID=A0A425Y1C7_9BACT|nr:M56 family metallopeptidase [Ancylomarina euxinus]MCZ4693810.1 M56 family metallopeptidase [Ancylomarina euxinus]MUP15111.1 TonB family protein [Ancylomarina euxinus]RRG21533.1 M56 family peptidase [Ancylomarina euxinus]
MNDFYIYLLKSSAALALFYGVYHFFLQDEKFYKGIRLYLASSLLMAFILPLIKMNFEVTEAANSSNIVILLNSINLRAEGTSTTGLLENISLTQFTVGFYTFICLILFLRSIIRINKTKNIIRNNPKDEYEGQELIKVDKETPNFSFIGKIVISDKEYNTESFRNIIAHERVHVKQKHWIDLLLVELTTIVLWFNPFAWLFERAIKQTHELLADEGVIAQGCNIGQYQASILNQIMGVEVMGLANNFNCSITKKRMIMMTKTNTSKHRIFKLLLVIPAIAIALTLNLKCTSETENPVEEEVVTITKADQALTKSETVDEETVFTVVEDMPQFPGGEKALQTWINQNVKYPELAQKNGIEGRVYIGFVVNKVGGVDRVKVLRASSPSLDAEALRVVSAMPKWTPGQQKGETVNVSFTIPINFALR